MARARLEVELAKLDLGARGIETKFFAESNRDPILAIIAYDTEDKNTVVACCDSFNYASFKQLFDSAEEVAKKLKTVSTIMPVNVIPNPMVLEIDVGALDIGHTGVRCRLSIDRQRTVEVRLSFSDLESDDFVFIRLSVVDYKRFRHFLRERSRNREPVCAKANRPPVPHA